MDSLLAANILLDKDNSAVNRILSINVVLVNWIFSSAFDFVFPEVQFVKEQLMISAILIVSSDPLFQKMLHQESTNFAI